MRYIICAFNGEARPFIDHFKLKRIHDLPYPLYQNENTLLIITQMGYENALMATNTLMGYRPPKGEDILINIGVCAAPKSYVIGELLIIHKINYKTDSYYPDILFQHNFKESDLLSVDTIQSSMHNLPVDMEAHAIFSSAPHFMQTHQMLFIKIVSDHFEPKNVKYKELTQSIRKRVPDIETLIAKAEAFCR